MANRTIWDQDIAGAGTETIWDGATNTIWDLLPDVLTQSVQVVWASVAKTVRWS